MKTIPGIAEKAKYLDLFQKLSDCVLLLDAQTFKIVDANPASEKFFGVSSAEMKGTSFCDKLWSAEQESSHQILRLARRRYHPQRSRGYWTSDALGKCLMEMTVGTLRLSDQEEVIQIIGRDVTQEHEMELKEKKYVEELRELNVKLELLSSTDAMTGLANFRHFTERLQEEQVRASRFESSYSLIFLDLDHFKHYNDQHGHPAGDVLLHELGSILRSCCRAKVDTVARYGGEEFVVLCPQTSLRGAAVLAGRILDAIRAHPFKEAKTQPLGLVSASIGVATFPVDGLTSQDVLKTADLRTYESKRTGRNRVTAS